MANKAYKLSHLAQRHLQQIKHYTVEHYSQRQWLIYKETLLLGFQRLADNPEIGRNCNDIFLGGFYFPVGKHMAYYTKVQEKAQEGILIVAVLGRSQLPKKHLK